MSVLVGGVACAVQVMSGSSSVLVSAVLGLPSVLAMIFAAVYSGMTK